MRKSSFCIWLRVSFVLIFLPLTLVAQPQSARTNRLREKQPITVFVQQVSQSRLEQNLVFPAMVQAFKEFPQQSFFRGIVHEIPVKIGDYVSVDQPIYKMQQINPGQEFLSSWVNALNSGIIVSIGVTKGEEVQQGAVVLTIADLSRYKAILHVSPKDVDKIKTDMPVYMIDEKKEVRDIGAKVLAVPLIPNTSTHLFDVEISMPKNSVLFLGKMEDFALLVQPFEGISVPQELIVQRSGQPTITIVREGKIVYQPVELGLLYQQNYAVLSGLLDSDVYVLSSSRRYKEGDAVLIYTPAE